jgi:hypothetical protein
MKLKLQKIVAKEILLLFLLIILTTVFWIFIHLNNLFQNNRIKEYKNNIEILSKNSILLKNHKNTIFNQLCKIKGGIIDKVYIPKSILLPNKFILDEKIGDFRYNIFEEFGGIKTKEPSFSFLYTLNNSDIIFKSEYPYDINKLNELGFINETQFYDSIFNSIKYRNEIFKTLKNTYNSSECNNLKKFEKLIGITTINNKQIKDDEQYQKELDTNIKQLENANNLKIEGYNINKTILYFLLVGFSILFLIRYVFYILKWSVNTLKIKH